MNDRRARTLECALEYIKNGWCVLPLYSVDLDGNCLCGKKDCQSPGKHPFTALVPNGAKNASADKETVERWFGSHYVLNIGIAAGWESRLVILDVDPEHGGLESIEKYDVPQTAHVKTGSGGDHYYFVHPGATVNVRNSAGTLGDGLDVRGHHGYVAAPPSLHRSGQEYRWAIDPRRVKPAPCPAWICSEQRHSPTAPTESTGIIPEGQRDNELTKIAGRLRRQGLDAAAIYGALAIVNRQRCQPCLPDSDVKRISESVSRYDPKPDKVPGKRRLIGRILDDIEEAEVEWMWHGRIPMKMLTLIIGDPGVGKTTLALAMAATVTRGGHWPDTDIPAPAGKAIIMTTEDDASTGIKPRFMAQGGDPKKFLIIDGVEEDGRTAPFTFQEHIRDLDEQLIHSNMQDEPVRLIILDPITAYLGRKVDQNSGGDIEHALGELAILARKHNLAILGLQHLNKESTKGALYRARGSTSFPGRARAVWLVCRDGESDDRNDALFAHVKGNYTSVFSCVQFRLDWKNRGKVRYGNLIDIEADEALKRGQDKQKEPSKRELVESMIVDELKRWGGPKDAALIQRDAKAKHNASARLCRDVAKGMEEMGRLAIARCGQGKNLTTLWALPDQAGLEDMIERIKQGDWQ